MLAMQAKCGYYKRNFFSFLKSSQVFQSTHCITLKRLTSWRGPSPRPLRPGNTASFKEMLQRCRAVGNTVSDLTCLRFQPYTSCFRDERVTARPTFSFSWLFITKLAQRCEYLAGFEIF